MLFFYLGFIVTSILFSLSLFFDRLSNLNFEICDNSDYLHSKNLDPSGEYGKITSESIAFTNGLEYLSVPIGRKIHSSGSNSNQIYAIDGKYILLYPPNDGTPKSTVQWYGKFNQRIEMIMDNQSAFKNITNLADIISQIIALYAKYIDKDIFISSFGFAIKLEDPISPNYVGRASLVLTNHSIKNSSVKPDELLSAKETFINDFLDTFIGLNFGVLIRANPKLEEQLLVFNDLVISKGLRKASRSAFGMSFSEDVQSYELKKA